MANEATNVSVVINGNRSVLVTWTGSSSYNRTSYRVYYIQGSTTKYLDLSDASATSCSISDNTFNLSVDLTVYVSTLTTSSTVYDSAPYTMEAYKWFEWRVPGLSVSQTGDVLTISWTDVGKTGVTYGISDRLGNYYGATAANATSFVFSPKTFNQSVTYAVTANYWGGNITFTISYRANLIAASTVTLTPYQERGFTVAWSGGTSGSTSNIIRYRVKDSSIFETIENATSGTLIEVRDGEWEVSIGAVYSQNTVYTNWETIVLSFHKTMKYYNGSAWVECIPSYYNGTAWIECEPMYYDGSQWIPCSH